MAKRRGTESGSRLGRADLVRAVAALQLLPENAGRHLFLKEVAANATRAPATGAQRFSRAAFESWISPAVRASSAEPPPPGPHTCVVTLPQQSFVVLPGRFEDQHWVLARLLDALSPENLEPAAVTALRGAAELGLRISDEIVRRAGLARNSEPLPQDRLSIPGTPRLRELMAAVSFRLAELNDMSADGDTGAPQAFCRAGPAIPVANFGDPSLWESPLVLEADDVVLAGVPDALCTASRHRTLRLANKMGIASELAAMFFEQVRSRVVTSLLRLGVFPHELEYARRSPTDVEMLGMFDRDKAIHVFLITDALLSYGDRAEGVWPLDVEAIRDRLADVETELMLKADAPNGLLQLVVVQGVGRGFSLVIDERDPRTGVRRVVLSASELDDLSRAEDSDAFQLWEFAGEAVDVRSHLRIAPMSQLEEFAIFRTAPGLDAFRAAPKHASIEFTGWARLLRCEFSVLRDVHGVKGPDGVMVSVMRSFEDEAVPVYESADDPWQTGAVVVPGDLPVWVVPASDDKTPTWYAWTTCIAYWVWQCRESLRRLFAAIEREAPAIVVGVTHMEPSIPAQLQATGWRVAPAGPAHVLVELAEDALDRLGGDDNQGERALMRDVFRAFCVLTGAESSVADEIVARHMEPPSKRKFVAVADSDPGLSRPVVPYRPLRETVTRRLRREVGHDLARSGIATAGGYSGDQAHAILNAGVAAAFSRLAATVRSLSADGLLELLVSLHERVVHQAATYGGELAVAVAAFGQDSAITRKRMAEELELSRAALAYRFLIEFCTAQPPRGVRPVSLSVIDELLGLASLLIFWGGASDLHRYRLAPIEVHVAPGNVVSVHAGRYEDRQAAYVLARMLGNIGRADVWLREHVVKVDEVAGVGAGADIRRSARDELPVELRALDAAFVEAYGARFSSLAEWLGFVSTLGESDVGGAQVVDRKAAVTASVEALGLTEAEVDGIFRLVCLTPRAEFLPAPNGYENADVYPWRFNRELSYLRRPILVKPRDDGEDIVLGPRHVHQSVTYLLGLLTHGRLRTSHARLRTAMGSIQRREARAFDEAVADLYRAHPDLVVDVRVKKIGGKRLVGKNGDLGDIDVLVLDGRRRRLVCIETKHLAAALTPHQLAHELAETFAPEGNSAAIRHQRRTTWVQNNLEHVKGAYGLPRGGRWKVEGIIVTDEESLSGYVAQSPVPVRSYHELRRAIAVGRLT